MTKNIDQQIHQSDYGTTFDIELRDGDTVINPATFDTVSNFVFRRPDQTTFTKAAASIITSSGSYLRYTSGSADFSQSGMWAIQAVVSDGIGSWSSEVKEFRVYPNLT